MTSPPKKYRLTTIKDIFDQVPACRIEDCLRQLGIAMRQTKEAAAAAGVVALVSERAIQYHVAWPEGLVWIDRGEGSTDVVFQTPDGADLFDVVIRLADA